MKQLISAFIPDHTKRAPDVCEILKHYAKNGLRIWMSDNRDELESFSNACYSKRNRANSIITPVTTRETDTFPQCKRFKYVIVFADVESWFYFFLPYTVDVSINQVMYRFLKLSIDYADEHTGTFLQNLKDADYDMNSMDFTELDEINVRLCELNELMSRAIGDTYRYKQACAEIFDI